MWSSEPKDYYDYPRPFSPTPGAVQVKNIHDTQVDSLLLPQNFCVGNVMIKARIKNVGIYTINALQIGWSYNKLIQTPINYNTAILDSIISSNNNFADIILGTKAIKASGDTLVFWIQHLGNKIDINSSNDTFRKVLYPTIPMIFVANNTACISSTVELKINGFTGNPLPITWNAGNTNNNLSNVAGQTDTVYNPTITQTTYYTASFNLDNVCNTDTVSIVSLNPIVTNTNDTIICQPSSVTLSVQAQGQNSIKWYNSRTAATPIFTGNNFTTPLINTTTYYMEAVFENGSFI